MKHMMIKVLSLVMALTMIMGMFGAVAVSAAGHTHTKGKTVKTVAPTCVAYGYTLYECADCGEQYADDVLPKAEECQNIKDVAAVDATCTDNALAAGKQCQDCGTYYVNGVAVSIEEMQIPNTALGHDKTVAIKQATCDEDGYVYETCKRCKNKDGSNIVIRVLESIAKTGKDGAHTYEYIIVKHPSCSEAGVASYRCVDCDEFTYDNIYVAPSAELHVWTIYDVEATCLRAGFEGRECKECYALEYGNEEDGFTAEGEMTPPTKHMNGSTKLWRRLVPTDAYAIENNMKLDSDFYKDATCTEDGFEWRYCKSCKTVWKEVLAHPEDHNWAKATYDDDNDASTAEVARPANDPEYKVVAATCEKAGYIVVGCLDCDVTKTVDNKTAAPCLSANGQHKWATGTKYEKDNGLWVVIEPTCLTAGYTQIKCHNKNCNEVKRENVTAALTCELIYVCDTCGADECTNCTHAGRKLICANANEFNGTAWVLKDEYKCADDDTTEADESLMVDTNKCEHENKAAVEAHKMTEGTKTIKVPATCTEYAYDAYYCTNDGCAHITKVVYKDVDDADNDGDKEEEIIKYKSEGFDATNHSGLKEIVSYRVNPTCKTAGSARYLCQNCSTNEYVTVVLPALEDHEDYWEERDEIAATCLNTGKTAGIFCTHPECGGVYEDDEYVSGGRYVEGGATIARDLTNHDTTTAVEGITRVGTCTVPTITFYTCPGNDKCSGGEFFVKGELDPYNHNSIVYNSDGTIFRDTTTAGEVTVDSEGNPVNHGKGIKDVPFTAPNCLEPGTHAHKTCEYCNAIWDVVDTGCYICAKANAIMQNPASSKTAGDWFSAHKKYTPDEDGTPYKYDEVVTRVIGALGHTWTAVAARAEKCALTGTDKDGDGYDDGYGFTSGHNCTTKWDDVDICDGVKGQNIIAPHGDKYVTEYAYVAPTCTTYGWGVDGAKFEDCSKCREAEANVTLRKGYIPADGHVYVKDSIASTANCTNVGYNVYKCNVCSNEKAAWVDANSNGIVDLYTDEANRKFSEYTWFVAEYVAPQGHNWKTNSDDTVKTFKGYIVNGEIVEERKVNAYDKCIYDAVEYKECSDCKIKEAASEVVAAPGHIHEEKNGNKTALYVDCLNINKNIGIKCTTCGLTIAKEDVKHNIVSVHREGYCTNEGTVPTIDYYACTDCNIALYNPNFYETVIDFTPTLEEAENYFTYDASNDDASTTDVDEAIKAALDEMNAILDEITTAHTFKWDTVDAYVEETVVSDGSVTYTCVNCGRTVTHIIDKNTNVLLTVGVKDVNGSKATANGNEVVISIAYSANNYKFRVFDVALAYNTGVLTFNKAEVKATFAENLAVTTDVEATAGKIDVLTMVNMPKTEAALAGDKVAYVDLYFTVNTKVDNVLADDYVTVKADILSYDNNGEIKTVVIQGNDKVVKANTLKSVATGDVDANTDVNTQDLVSIMDIIYTADAKYVAAADVNKDGKIDIDDYAAIRTFVASNKTVADYAAMLGETFVKVDYATMILDILRVQKIDLNDDGVINALDFTYLVNKVNSEDAKKLVELYNGTNYSWNAYFTGATYSSTTVAAKVLSVYAAYLASLTPRV